MHTHPASLGSAETANLLSGKKAWARRICCARPTPNRSSARQRASGKRCAGRPPAGPREHAATISGHRTHGGIEQRDEGVMAGIPAEQKKAASLFLNELPTVV